MESHLKERPSSSTEAKNPKTEWQLNQAHSTTNIYKLGKQLWRTNPSPTKNKKFRTAVQRPVARYIPRVCSRPPPPIYNCYLSCFMNKKRTVLANIYERPYAHHIMLAKNIASYRHTAKMALFKVIVDLKHALCCKCFPNNYFPWLSTSWRMWYFD
jgi:hypothetical protein